MNYIFFLIILGSLYFQIRKDNVFYIALLYMIIVRFNSLISYNAFTIEPLDFADYFFFVFSLLYVKFFVLQKQPKIYYANSPLYKLLILYILYYVFLFFYSMLISKIDVLPALKTGRYLFFGLVILMTLKLLSPSPIAKFNLLIKYINKLTVFLSLLFIIDSFFNVNIFVILEGYTFNTEDGLELKRNFHAYPFFSGYCILYNVYYFIMSTNKTEKITHLLYIVVLYVAMITIMTRGLLISTILCSLIMFFTVNFNYKRIGSMLALAALVIIIIYSGILNHFPAYTVLMDRMTEVKTEGISGTSNFAVRTFWLNKAIDNINAFNPLFGFGYTETKSLGYTFLTNSAVNPDTAWANIIGVQGYVGLIIYLCVIITWLYVNIKLQRRHVESFSKINFVYMLWSLINTLDGNQFSFIHTFAIFISYDFLCYAYLNKKICKNNPKFISQLNLNP